MQIGELFYKITGDTSGLDKSLKKTDGQVKASGKGLSGLGGILKGAAFAGAAVFAAKKVVELGGSLITAASDAEETRNKFSVVFKDVADEAAAAAEALSDNFGLSSKAAQTLLSDTGDLLTGFGFTGESALDLSTQVNELAVDLASFTNFSGGAEGASQALTKALLGERESVKALGISILEEDVKAKILLNTKEGLTFETERQAKAYATLQLAQEQSENAQGDFARSSESFANQQRIAAAAVDDLKVALGDRLLPTATTATSIFGSLTRAIADSVTETNKYYDLLKASNAGEGFGDTGKDVETLQITLDRLNAEVELNGLGWEAATDKQIKFRRSLEASIDALGIEDTFLINNRELQEANTRATNESAEAQAKAAKDLADYLELVNTEYSETQKGKLESLEEEIALWESYAETAVVTGPKVQEVLKELIQEYNNLLAQSEETTEGLSYNEEVALENTQTYHDALLQINSISAAEEIAIQKAKNEEIARAEAELLAARQASYSSFFGGISALANAFQAQNRAQFIVQRALASASAGINSYLAFTKTLVDGGPFPFNTINAAGVLASGLAQQVQIFSTPAPAFQNGGIVPGNSFSGDNVQARVNSGEMVLNREQQKQLFNLANGAGGGNQTIVIKIGNTDFAKAVVNSVNSGAGGVVDARVVR